MKEVLKFIWGELKLSFRRLRSALQELCHHKNVVARENRLSRIVFLIRFPGHLRAIFVRLLLDFYFVSIVTDYMRKHSVKLGIILVSLSVVFEIFVSKRLNHIQLLFILLISLLVIDCIANKVTGEKEDLNNDLLYLNLMLFYVNLLNIMLFFFDYIIKIIQLI